MCVASLCARQELGPCACELKGPCTDERPDVECARLEKALFFASNELGQAKAMSEPRATKRPYAWAGNVWPLVRFVGVQKDDPSSHDTFHLRRQCEWPLKGVFCEVVVEAPNGAFYCANRGVFGVGPAVLKLEVGNAP